VVASKYAVYIEKENDDLLFYVTDNGEQIDIHDYKKNLPPILYQLISYATYFSGALQHFMHDLHKSSDLYPIIFKDGSNEIAIKWDPLIEYELYTEIDTSKTVTTLTKKSRSNDGGREILIIRDFVFDLTNNTFGLVTDTSGWMLYSMINNASIGSDMEKTHSQYDQWHTTSFEISSVNLENINIVIAPGEKNMILKSAVFRVGGKDVGVELTPSPSYAMNVLDKGDFYILRPERRLPATDDAPIIPCMDSFDFFHSEMPGGLNSKKKKEHLHQVLFEAVSGRKKKTRDEIIKDRLSSVILGGNHNVLNALRLLKHFIRLILDEKLYLHYNRGVWMLTPTDGADEIHLYSIPYKIFGNKLSYSNTLDDRISIKKEDFLPGLAALVEMLAQRGIKTRLVDSTGSHPKDIVVSSLNFEFNTVKTSIDWFELKPEIKCDGRIIPDSLWQAALKSDGIIEHEGGIHILDAASIETLRTIGRITGADGKKYKDKSIFRVPRLRIFDWITLRKGGVKLALPPEDEEILNRLTGFERIEERALPSGLNAKLRQYQKDGYYWLAFLYEHKFGACLADDMGLGKTIQTIVFLAGLKEGKIVSENRHPNLIVLPPTLLFNWENEINRFYPGLKTYSYKGKERCLDAADHDVILTTYALARRDIDKLCEMRFNVIVFDEAQAVKNIHSDTTSAVRRLNARFKLALTGTPVENHVGEYFSIMDLSLPGLLGEYDIVKKQSDDETIARILSRTKPFVLRRTKGEILKELPPKTEHDVYLELNEKQKALYNRTVAEVRRTIDNAFRTKTAAQAGIVAITALLKLRQICLSTKLLLPDEKNESPKIQFLLGKLLELWSEGYSALIFSQFTSFLDIVEAELKGCDYRIFRLDGSTPIGKRKKLVEDFQGAETPSLFLLSLKAGGQGLNLTKASYVFHLDPWWNPAVENQASDRAHRIGQKDKVIVTRLLMKHTVEEKIMELKKRKLNLYNAIMDSTSKSGFSITKEDLDYILGAV
jgi:non-specific serine/threonine protein kinase